MSRNVLLLGGSGRVARYLTPMLLQPARGWNVTSVIRDETQIPELKKLGEGLGAGSGVLTVSADAKYSLDNIDSDQKALDIIDEIKPDYIVWSAGAGGKGGPERTRQIDQVAASHFIRAAVAKAGVDRPKVSKFLMVSHITSREDKPSWWTEGVFSEAMASIKKALPAYYEAKLEADKVLYQVGKEHATDFAAINLRPGLLTFDPMGKVDLGKIPRAQGKTSRESVANVAALLLDAEGIKSCWVDMLDGETDAAEAVDKLVKEGVDCSEGEAWTSKL